MAPAGVAVGSLLSKFDLWNQSVPSKFTALGQLGWNAAPVVNFNFTDIVSMLLKEPSYGGVEIIGPHGKFSSPKVHDSEQAHSIVRHPHGLLRTSPEGEGILLTKADYDRVADGNLPSFHTAIVSASNRALAVVGMSLDDDYLRETIAKHRNLVGDIYWFVEGDSPHEEWAAANAINVVRSEHDVFWKGVADTLCCPPEDRVLHVTGWLHAIFSSKA